MDGWYFLCVQVTILFSLFIVTNICFLDNHKQIINKRMGAQYITNYPINIERRRKDRTVELETFCTEYQHAMKPSHPNRIQSQKIQSQKIIPLYFNK